jgi:hypothetical protein
MGTAYGMNGRDNTCIQGFGEKTQSEETIWKAYV